MPGLSQLKKFSSDLLSLGDEVQLRATRGEQPVKIEIPQEVKDNDDSEDFVLGMPEIEAEIPQEEVDDDLSDLADLTNPVSENAEGEEETPAPSFEAPDMSSLLNPIGESDFTGTDMPDLSMFADEPQEEEQQIIEEEPEEISIADMGLDALLSGGGFDQPAEEKEDSVLLDNEPLATEPETEIEPVGIYDDLNDFDDLEEIDEVEEAEEAAEADKIDQTDEIEEADKIDQTDEIEEADKIGEVDEVEDVDEIDEIPEIPEFESESEAVPSFDNDFGDIEDFNSPAEGNQLETEDFDLPFDDLQIPEDNFESGNVENDSDIEDLSEVEELDDVGGEEPKSEEPELEDIGLDDAGLGDPLEQSGDEVTASGIGVDDFNIPEDNLSDNKIPEFSDLELNLDEDKRQEDNKEQDNFDIEDLNMNLDSFDSTDFSESKDEVPVLEDEFSSSVPEGLFDSNDVEFDAKDEIPDYDDFSSVQDDSENSENSENSEEPNLEPLEIFDTSEMEGLDFDIPDTDSQLSNADDDSAFDVPRDDDFDSEFEIPGYSDVDTVKEQKSTVKLATGKDKKQKQKKIPASQVDKEESVEDLPPNTLTDKQYKIFRKNLSEYPLNVRLAFEDFMVQDEFTDDAEFEVIEKILNKAPARQVASTLEKMLDISIPVPRDFEHRSADEYEAYKKSVSYQLKNRIIPAILLGILGILVCIGLFNFSKNCIYKPLKANSLYKQGYVLLEQTEYPLSEIKFNEATKYRLSKKWFYNYARGYREHKQYQRAGQMYKNILNCFKHDKAAGLEYADMELNDLANYARAEEIVKREVLDYHINDADGILMLGDVYLEWATEKDNSKFELAREQYATLLQLYGQTDLYLSRMMRYFIRTDNLREVLQLKQTFAPREKSLGADDWTEMSGYLLDKYYGELSPSEEYLRYEIEGLRDLLLRAVKSNPANPIALYNLARYFINTNEYEFIESTLQDSIEKFNALEKMKRRDIYKYIDAYRLLGEHYITIDNFLQAQEQFAEGISLYITERDNAGFKGTPEIGELYEDMGNIKYTISGDYDDALFNYSQSVELENDNPRIRYRIGYIQYNKKNYGEALGSFMKAGEGNVKERNLLLAMANTLSLRGDDYAAEGYYEQLIENLDSELAERGLVIPQTSIKDFDIVNTYLYAANNYGVTLYRLAKKTGDSNKNAQSIVQFSQSVRAWDALTRNPETMIRLEGSNLAEQNIKYVTHPIPEFEPSIYTNIAKTLLDNEKL